MLLILFVNFFCRMAPEVILAMDEGVYDGKVSTCYMLGMGKNRENHDNLASSNRIVIIFLVFNNRKSQ